MKQNSRSKKTTACKKTHPRKKQHAGGGETALNQLLEMLTPGQQVLFTGAAILKKFSDTLFIVYFEDTKQMCDKEEASELLAKVLVKDWNTKSIKLSYVLKDGDLIEVDATPVKIVYTRIAKEIVDHIDTNAPDIVHYYTHPNHYHYDHAPVAAYDYELVTPSHVILNSLSSVSDLDKLLMAICKNHP